RAAQHVCVLATERHPVRGHCRRVALSPYGVDTRRTYAHQGVAPGGRGGACGVLRVAAAARAHDISGHRDDGGFLPFRALVFGGGHVVLPLLREAVVVPGWGRSTSAGCFRPSTAPAWRILARRSPKRTPRRSAVRIAVPSRAAIRATRRRISHIFARGFRSSQSRESSISTPRQPGHDARHGCDRGQCVGDGTEVGAIQYGKTGK